MKDFLDQYSIVVISLLLGLSSSGLVVKHPEVGIWLSYLSIFLLIVVVVRYILIRLLNKFVPRRYANLIFMLDEENNLAVLKHPLYSRIQPPGGRLFYNESLHLSISRIIKKELGLEETSYKVVSDDNSLERYGTAYLVPRPFQIQVEIGSHKLGVREHYDFVYVCFAKGIKPILDSSFHAIWVSLDELEDFSKKNIQNAPWESIIPTFKKVIKNRKKLKYNEMDVVSIER